MAFLLEQPHLHRDSVAAQGLGHAFGLLRRHHLVLQPLEEQHRATDAIGMQQGRPLLKDLPLLWPVANQAVQVAGLKAVGCLLYTSPSPRDPT